MGKNNKGKFGIPDPNTQFKDNIKFSFKFYDTSCNSYCISTWKQNDIALTLKRLQDISSKTFSEISRKNSYGFRPVSWEQTIKKDGFPDKNANQFDAFHFSLIGVNGQKARIFGAFASNVFYIVWFDLEHEIWPSLKPNT